MTLNETPVEMLSSELEGQVQKIEASCSTITAELKKGLPVNAARVNAEMLTITHLRSQFFVFFQRFTMAQREASEHQRQEDGGRGILPVEWQRLNTRIGHVRIWLNQWTNAQSVLRDVLARRRSKLYQRTAPPGSVMQAQNDTTDMLFGQLAAVLNPHGQSDEARDLGCYKDIGYPMTAFLGHMHAAYRVLLAMGRVHGGSFLDVGCGGGIKVLAARRFFKKTSGLEFDRNYAARARKLLREAGQGGSRIIRANAMTYRKYEDYDVVFMFRPMSDGEQLKLLEQQVIDRVRPRTVIIAPYKSFAAKATDRACPRIDGSMFLAKSTKADAVDLRRRAEMTGSSVGQHDSKFPGLFDSILAAAAGNGFRFEDSNTLLDA
jgi:SAM-dependent methyltransferase